MAESPEEESLDELLDRIKSGGTGSQSFTISSDIGRDDYRSFLYFSVFGKNKPVTAAVILLPAALTFYFNIRDGKLMLLPAIIITVLLWLFIFGAIIFMTERSLRKIGKKNPEELRLTKIEYRFVGDAILYTKNGKTTRVPYSNLLTVGKTKKRFFMYFQGRKGMIIRTEDIVKNMGLNEFENFMNLKLQK